MEMGPLHSLISSTSLLGTLGTLYLEPSVIGRPSLKDYWPEQSRESGLVSGKCVGLQSPSATFQIYYRACSSRGRYSAIWEILGGYSWIWVSSLSTKVGEPGV